MRGRFTDQGWGRGRHPALNVSWEEAQSYVTWLSRITGKKYRLLSEAEYEYAARAGTQTAYPWGDDIKLNGAAMANCDRCGSQWDNKQTAPVGSFPFNQFGLYDMVGNIWEWVEDCYHPAYQVRTLGDDLVEAPSDGSAWISHDCSNRVVRGGSWFNFSLIVRSASGDQRATDARAYNIGFRVGRTLTP